jgi:thioredoxin reductase
VIFNSTPIEFKETSVILEVGGQSREIPNDFVWIFAGGEPPTAFLKKIGIRVGIQDVTTESSGEAKKVRHGTQLAFVAFQAARSFH